MKAGRDGNQKSVSPLEIDSVENGSDGDNEDMEKDPEGEDCKRSALHRESGEVRQLIDPLLPRRREVEDHWVRGHLPYRNWCHVCVRSRGRGMDHQKDKGKERKLHEYHFDYRFPGDEFGFKWTILVGKERMSKSWFATAVPQKGASGRFATDKCVGFFEENGDGDRKVVIKTDQEPSIQYLVKDIVDRGKERRAIVEESPVKSSGSNGVVERGVQEVEGGVGALLLGLQDRIGRDIDSRERIKGVIPEYVAYRLNRLGQGEDGKVQYERMKGKTPTILGIEFREKLLHKEKKKHKL